MPAAAELRTFHGGVHPPERKSLGEDAAIEVLPTPKIVYAPMLQHTGAPCTPVVKTRAQVSVGELLGEPNGFISAAVHASVDGEVGREGTITLANGRHVPMLPIIPAPEQSYSSDELFAQQLGGTWPVDNAVHYEADQIVAAARAAGLVGLGGAAFPTHVKLTRNPAKPITDLLINGCECEPYLNTDYRLMLEVSAAIATGARLARIAIGAERAVICIEDNKPRAIKAMEDVVAGTEVAVQRLATKYPQGGEKQLIGAVTGRAVPLGALPLDVGVVVMNVGTCVALARSVVRKLPLTHHVVSVTGHGVATPKNLLVPLGTRFKELIDFCGGLTDDAARVIAGGPMMGFTVGSLSAPVTKGTNGITVLTHNEVRRSAETNCVRCGRCVDVCPMNLVPTKLALATRFNSLAQAERYHLMACMECGSCAYVCPASLPLVQLIRVGKIRLRNKGN